MLWKILRQRDIFLPQDWKKRPPLQRDSDETAVKKKKYLPTYRYKLASFQSPPTPTPPLRPPWTTARLLAVAKKLPELSLHRWRSELEIDGGGKVAETKLKRRGPDGWYLGYWDSRPSWLMASSAFFNTMNEWSQQPPVLCAVPAGKARDRFFFFFGHSRIEKRESQWTWTNVWFSKKGVKKNESFEGLHLSCPDSELN